MIDEKSGWIITAEKTTQTEKDAIKKAQAMYHKEWKEKNKEKVKKYQERYWLKKAVEYGLI